MKVTVLALKINWVTLNFDDERYRADGIDAA